MPVLTSDDDLRRLLLAARTIAVVGLSDNPQRDSNRVTRYLQSRGYTIIPVNPNLTTWMGLRAYPDLRSVRPPVDIVDVFRRPEHVPAIVDAAISLGARAVWMQLGIIHEAAASKASASGLEVVMNRCILIEHRRLVGTAPE